jgi:hypothetical protein
MSDDKYTHADPHIALAFISNAMEGGGDKGRTFPYSDAEDLSRGLRFIPGEVTEARRAGQRVAFVDQHCHHACCWYWQFEYGDRIGYYDPADYRLIASQNGNEPDEQGRLIAGPCPDCGNIHTRGGHVSKHDIQVKA